MIKRGEHVCPIGNNQPCRVSPLHSVSVSQGLGVVACAPWLSLCLSRRRHLPTVLVRVEPGVIPLAGEQLRMRPVFDNAPLLDHQNGVR